MASKTQSVLLFELNYKGSPSSFWFAINAYKMGKKGTFAYIKNKFSEERLTYYDKDEKEYVYKFTKKDYDSLKEYVEKGGEEWWDPAVELFPSAVFVKRFMVDKIPITKN